MEAVNKMTQDDKIVRTIALSVFHNYKHYIKDRLQKSLRRQFSESELERTLQTVVTSDEFTTTASVIFADYGRIVDMERKFQNPPPPLEAIERWMRQKGLYKPENVPGYTHSLDRRRSSLTEEQGIRRVARAITNSMKVKTRRRAWYAGKMYRSIGWLIHSLQKELAKHVAKEIVKQVTL